MIVDMNPLWISLKTATTATIITFFLGIFIARWMAYSKIRGKAFIDVVLILPMVLPPTVVGFLLLMLLGTNGFIGQALAKFDINIIFSWEATVIASTVVAFPLMYKTARGAFEQIDYNLIDAGKTLGLSDWEIFWKLIMPISWPGIGAGVILSFARALGEFGATLMLAGSIPGKTQTIPIAIFFAVDGSDINKAFFWVLIVLIISFSSIFALNYLSKKQNPTSNYYRG